MTCRLTRRSFLKGMSIAQAPVWLGLPPLEAFFNDTGTAYAADGAPIEKRFILWFNGNGIPEKYWIPTETGSGFSLTPCLAPLAPFRNDIHGVTGLDNAAAQIAGPGHGRPRSETSRRPLRACRRNTTVWTHRNLTAIRRTGPESPACSRICLPARWPHGRPGPLPTCSRNARAWLAFRGWAIPPRAITTTHTATARRPEPTGPMGSASCATSADGTSKSSPTLWAD